MYFTQQSVQQHTKLLSWTKCWQSSERHAPCPWRVGVRQRGSLMYVYITTFYTCLLEGYIFTCNSIICSITDKPVTVKIWHLFHWSFPDPSPACTPGWLFKDPSGCHFLFSSPFLNTACGSPFHLTNYLHWCILHDRLLLTIYLTSKPNKLLLYSVSPSASETVDYLKISSVSLTLTQESLAWPPHFTVPFTLLLSCKL